MPFIHQHSIARAFEGAIEVWAYTSAQYPVGMHAVLDGVAAALVERVSSFALNARRAIERVPGKVAFKLECARWDWQPTAEGELVVDLWEALNRVVRARELQVGFEALPARVSVIEGGALVVPYIRASTDRRPVAYIDPFAMAHAFIYRAYPILLGSADRSETAMH